MSEINKMAPPKYRVRLAYASKHITLWVGEAKGDRGL